MNISSRLIRDAGLDQVAFDGAYNKAVALYQAQGIDIEQSERIKLCAAAGYRPGKSICDLGSYINIYPVMWALLGMQVTTVDYYPQRDPTHRYHKPEIDRALGIYREVGITAIESDLFEHEFDQQYDVISSFETFEHLWHSPKPIMQKSVAALRAGGEFVLSVPNIARLMSRVNALRGKSVLPPFPVYYEHGNPFTGHRREMTREEVDWMMRTEGLRKLKLFTANAMPPSTPRSTATKLVRWVEDHMPIPCLRSQIFAVYVKH